ncbi:flavin reductase family protein [Sinorhizobium meliloti]|uniref:flavin reductase family protein n=1 Tax=Rhizobium meliloti TaxID=382 RepID=UPI000FD8F33A|nr:flavin reductase family protein [Sinorhizobium meliloti]MDE3823007.1 flavin reductase family protein [Sinorhizobium meliloti]RVM41540.1 flavin reductase [Sinorhizobium meliloti]RVN59157.1 flavin reductase [Sinorhizobium meliloti]RVO29089.1 flavin reductase [Sinorhizobium meliloti]RVP53785.1 flavin reductase [Sinorhizobium meliloti]
MTSDARALRDAFGAFLTGVTVVTTVDEAGSPIGFTANSFTSVSLDPPLLLVCLAKTSRNYATLTGAKGFGVNILSEGQKDVSNTFARPVEDRFAAVDWRPGPHGSPVFADVAAWFDCATHEVVDAGDHVILVGRVEGFENSGKTGLGYARGGYFTPTLAEKSLLASAESLLLGAVAVRNDEILLVDDGKGGWTLPFVEKAEVDGIESLEHHIAQTAGLTLTTGLLYSVYEDTKTGRQHVVYRGALGEGTPKSGRFFPIQAPPVADISDSAVREIVKRFGAESMLGNFGVYFGNQEKGRVHTVAAKG